MRDRSKQSPSEQVFLWKAAASLQLSDGGGIVEVEGAVFGAVQDVMGWAEQDASLKQGSAKVVDLRMLRLAEADVIAECKVLGEREKG